MEYQSINILVSEEENNSDIQFNPMPTQRGSTWSNSYLEGVN